MEQYFWRSVRFIYENINFQPQIPLFEYQSAYVYEKMCVERRSLNHYLLQKRNFGYLKCLSERGWANTSLYSPTRENHGSVTDNQRQVSTHREERRAWCIQGVGSRVCCPLSLTSELCVFGWTAGSSWMLNIFAPLSLNSCQRLTGQD